MKKIKNLNCYAIYQAGARDVKKYGFEDGSFYVYFASDVRDFGLTNSTPEFEGCGSLEEAEANCTGNFARAKEIVEERTTAASMEEILEAEAMLDAGVDPDDIDELTEQETVADVIASKFPGVPSSDVITFANQLEQTRPGITPDKAAVDPKHWHYYKHAKKARIRKKYRRRLTENQLATMQAAGAHGRARHTENSS